MKRKLTGIATMLIILASTIAVLGLAACSSSPAPTTTSSPASTTSPTGKAVTVDLVAKNFAFNMSTITVPAGAQVTVNFDNQDSGIPHNFAVYTNSGAASSIFVGQVITGPAKVTYKFTAPAGPGTNFFRCDIHPGSMTGSFIVQ